MSAATSIREIRFMVEFLIGSRGSGAARRPPGSDAPPSPDPLASLVPERCGARGARRANGLGAGRRAAPGARVSRAVQTGPAR